MKKDLLLILRIYEGRGWRPLTGYNTFIEAKLGSYTSSTESIPLTSTPKFNSEIFWQVEKQVLRSYKLNRIPIKIECYAIDGGNNKRLLGYVILGLNSTAEGLTTDPKWHKLLGGPSLSQKSPSTILLGLSVEAMTLDKKNHINEEQAIMKNGNHSFETKSYFMNGNKFPSSITVTKCIPHSTQNGEKVVNNPLGFQSNGNNERLSLSPDNREDIEDMEMLSDEEEGEENELEDFPSDEEMAACQLFEGTDQLFMNNSYTKTKEESVAQDVNKKTLVQSTSESSSVADKSKQGISPHKEESNFYKSRKSSLETFQGISAELIRHRKLQSSYNEDSMEKRLLDNLSPTIPFEHKKKCLRVDSCEDTVSSLLKVDANSDAKIYEKQVESSPIFSPLAGTSKIYTDAPNKKKLTASLNQEKGVLQIGPAGLPDEKAFNFSITICEAQNLSRVVPENILSSLSDGFQFCFSILGCPVYTDTFLELDEPAFQPEKTNAKVHSTLENLSEYFCQHSFIPIYLLSGDTTLASCTLDLLQLKNIVSSNINFKVSYKLCPMTSIAASDSDNLDSFEANISILVELCRVPFVKNFHTSPGKQIKSKQEESFSRVLTSSDSGDNSSDAHYSDLDEHANSIVKSIKKYSKKAGIERSRRERKNKVTKLLKLQLEGELQKYKKKLLQEAAFEVEEWKEQQMKNNVKEWSKKEKTLQKHLASEWSTKIKIVESEVESRLKECDELQDRMTSALRDLKLREERLKERESKVQLAEDDLHKERLKIQAMVAPIRNPLESQSHNRSINQHLEIEKNRRQQLEKQVSKLQDDLRKMEENFTDKMHENLNLRKRLVVNDEPLSWRKENEILNEKLSSALTRKDYYKNQYLGAINDLHKLHDAHKRTIDDILVEVKRSSPEPVVIPSRGLTGEDESTKFHVKVKKLINERKTLVNSGLYTVNHPLIKNIDQKMQKLSDSTYK